MDFFLLFKHSNMNTMYVWKIHNSHEQSHNHRLQEHHYLYKQMVPSSLFN